MHKFLTVSVFFLYLTGLFSCRSKQVLPEEHMVVVVDNNFIEINNLPQGWKQTSSAGKSWIKVVIENKTGFQSQINFDWESQEINISGNDIIVKIDNRTESKVVYNHAK